MSEPAYDPADMDGQGVLFDLEMPPPISLADKFGVAAPMSVIDRRGGEWQARKRRWLSLGMESETGRSGSLTYDNHGRGGPHNDPVSVKLREMSGGTSVFDPVTCELTYRWWSAPGDRVLDPFAGGSVRGIVASTLGRWYDGVDIRAEQVEANRRQAHLGSEITPRWLLGDSTRLASVDGIGDGYDFVFTCPPYHDLEVYSDDPRDISTWTWEEFVAGQGAVIRASAERLNKDRFAAWVTSDIRGKDGNYRGLRDITVSQFAAAGMSLLNDAIVVDPVGTGALRAERPFRTRRKLTRTHQHLLVFVKGSSKVAAGRIEADA